MEFKPRVNMGLDALEDAAGRSVFVGRSQSLHRKYGREGALLLGKVAEQEKYGEFIYLDALMPHTVFVCGAKGSGKSYTLGVIAEELIYKNPNVAVVIIDPIGIYWSMKYPNQEETELDELIRMGLAPRGVAETRVFVPYGVRNTLPKDTYDKTYALRPADLNVDDWCITFDIDRFSPTGLLLEKALEKVFNGYKTTENKHVNPNPDYGLEEIINCLNADAELVSKAKGFKSDSRRALTSRFESAKSWGIFSANGTPLVDLCQEGKVSVIDVSFLDEKVNALVIGLLARKILNARKLATRKSAMKRLAVSMEEVLETGIPPTWLFIDEAHTLIPSGSQKTAASDAMIEYVKQGRRPGCSLVMATQQPSALDTKVLSQLDLLVCHKLTFDDDIKAVFKRMPADIPKEYSSRFIKTLPIGHCLIGDRSDHTNRVFAAHLRPRFSQHEGRETRSVDFEETLSEEQVEGLVIKMVKKQLVDFGRVNLSKIDQLARTINKRYGTKVSAKKVVKAIGEADVDNEQLVLKEILEQETVAAEEVQEDEPIPEAVSGENLLVFKAELDEERAKARALKQRKAKLFGLFGEDEALKDFRLEYWPIYKVDYDYYQGTGFKRSVCFVDGMNGELLSVGKSGMASTKGVGALAAMNKSKRKIIVALRKGKQASAKGIASVANITETTARTNAEDLAEDGLLVAVDDGRARTYTLKQQFDLPQAINTPEYTTLESRFVMGEASGFVPTPRVAKESVADIPTVFGEVKIRDISFVYRPVYHASFASAKGPRDVYIDGIDGGVAK
ncbi:helicase HerA domain-containing protein [archaeon]